MKDGLRHGFTFIELMVTVAITMFLFTGLVSGYNRFTDSSRIKQAALSFKNNLRLAQTNAESGIKPLNLQCDELVGYQVSFTTTSYTIQAQCNSDQPHQSVAPKTTGTLPVNVSFSPLPAGFTFGVLTRGVNIGTDETFTFVGAGASGILKYDLKLSPEGEITDVGFH